MMDGRGRGSRAGGKGACVLGQQAPTVSKPEFYDKIQYVVVCRNSSISNDEGTAKIRTRFGAENA